MKGVDGTMTLPKFRNQNGFTLIETLASLALLSLIIILGMGFMLNASENKDSVVTASELQQKTNILVASMQQNYYDNSGVGELSFIDPAPYFEIERLIVNGVDRTGESPLVDIDFSQALAIDVTTISPDGKQLTMQTSWRPEENAEMSMNP